MSVRENILFDYLIFSFVFIGIFGFSAATVIAVFLGLLFIAVVMYIVGPDEEDDNDNLDN